jgi:iron transport multicopper oxidase
VNDNAKMHFQPGKTYKIRIVNMSALASEFSPALKCAEAPTHAAVFYIALDQHDIYVIETDGIEIEPYKLEVITISVAQRYSILVTAKNETNLNYAMSIMQAEEM